MDKRISIVSIIIEEPEASTKVNALLHQYQEFICGRMGLPMRERGIAMISIVMDAPMDKTSALSGKLGMIPGVSAKTLTAAK